MSTRSGAVIVGAGLMGRWHAHALQTLGLPVIAVVDTDAQRAHALAGRHGATALQDLSDAMERHPLAVHLCVPPPAHGQLAALALGGGAHILVEKPFTESAAAAARVLAMAEERGLIACPVHQFLFQRGMRAALRRAGEYGPLRHVDFTACSAGAEGPTDSPARRSQLVRDILPHPLSILRRLASAALDVSDWHVVAPVPGEARITGAIGGMTVSILVSASGRPTRNAIRFVGARGTMDIDLFHGFATFEHGGVSRAAKVIRPLAASADTFLVASANLARRAWERQPAYPGLRELVSEFYKAIAAGPAAPVSPAETRDVAQATEVLTMRLPR